MKNWRDTFLSSFTYIQQFRKHVRIDEDDYYRDLIVDKKYYDGFSTLIELCDTYKIDMIPYLFTIRKSDDIINERFNRFFLLGLKKSNLHNDLCLPIESTLKLIENDIVLLLAFVITMQYYFL